MRGGSRCGRAWGLVAAVKLLLEGDVEGLAVRIKGVWVEIQVPELAKGFHWVGRCGCCDWSICLNMKSAGAQPPRPCFQPPTFVPPSCPKRNSNPSRSSTSKTSSQRLRSLCLQRPTSRTSLPGFSLIQQHLTCTISNKIPLPPHQFLQLPQMTW